jgi:hypothetical protein
MGLEGDTTGILDVIPNPRRLAFAIEKLKPQRKIWGAANKIALAETNKIQSGVSRGYIIDSVNRLCPRPNRI